MRTRTSKTSRQDAPHDVGTLWTMQRDERVARCALMAWPGEWELRVVVDGEILLAERCARSDEAFTLADKWKRRMLDRSWQQVLPRPAQAVGLEDRRSA